MRWRKAQLRPAIRRYSSFIRVTDLKARLKAKQKGKNAWQAAVIVDVRIKLFILYTPLPSLTSRTPSRFLTVFPTGSPGARITGVVRCDSSTLGRSFRQAGDRATIRSQREAGEPGAGGIPDLTPLNQDRFTISDLPALSRLAAHVGYNDATWTPESKDGF